MASVAQVQHRRLCLETSTHDYQWLYCTRCAKLEIEAAEKARKLSIALADS